MPDKKPIRNPCYLIPKNFLELKKIHEETAYFAVSSGELRTCTAGFGLRMSWLLPTYQAKLGRCEVGRTYFAHKSGEWVAAEELLERNYSRGGPVAPFHELKKQRCPSCGCLAYIIECHEDWGVETGLAVTVKYYICFRCRDSEYARGWKFDGGIEY